MSKYNNLGGKGTTEGGSFTDIRDLLKTLFADPACRGERCWIEVLDEMARPSRIEYDSYLAKAIRRVPPYDR